MQRLTVNNAQWCEPYVARLTKMNGTFVHSWSEHSENVTVHFCSFWDVASIINANIRTYLRDRRLGLSYDTLLRFIAQNGKTVWADVMDGTESMPESTLIKLYCIASKEANGPGKLIAYAPPSPRHGMATWPMAPPIPGVIFFNRKRYSKNMRVIKLPNLWHNVV